MVALRMRTMLFTLLFVCAQCETVLEDVRQYLGDVYPAGRESFANASSQQLQFLFSSLSYFLGDPSLPNIRDDGTSLACVPGSARGTVTRALYNDLVPHASPGDQLALGAQAWSQREQSASNPEWILEALRLSSGYAEVAHWAANSHFDKDGASQFLDSGLAAIWYFLRRGSGVFYEIGNAATFANKNQAMKELLEELDTRTDKAQLYDTYFGVRGPKSRKHIYEGVVTTLEVDSEKRKTCSEVNLWCRESEILDDAYDEVMIWIARALGYDTMIYAASPLWGGPSCCEFEIADLRLPTDEWRASAALRTYNYTTIIHHKKPPPEFRRTPEFRKIPSFFESWAAYTQKHNILTKRDPLNLERSLPCTFNEESMQIYCEGSRSELFRNVMPCWVDRLRSQDAAAAKGDNFAHLLRLSRAFVTRSVEEDEV